MEIFCMGKVDLSDLTIMIVDDALLSRKVIERMLKTRGAKIMECRNGLEAIRRLEEECPDIILLDILMPEMDGFAVLAEMKKRGIEIPVVVLSADIQNSSKEKCLELGASGFLNKPVREEELFAAINDVMSAGA
jgi:twitching motility two-component system response regulator PilH